MMLLPIFLAIHAAEDDSGLVARMQRRDPQALAELYDRYGRLTFSLILIGDVPRVGYYRFRDILGMGQPKHHIALAALDQVGQQSLRSFGKQQSVRKAAE
jgi:hypothetical protein